MNWKTASSLNPPSGNDLFSVIWTYIKKKTIDKYFLKIAIEGEKIVTFRSLKSLKQVLYKISRHYKGVRFMRPSMFFTEFGHPDWTTVVWAYVNPYDPIPIKLAVLSELPVGASYQQ